MRLLGLLGFCVCTLLPLFRKIRLSKEVESHIENIIDAILHLQHCPQLLHRGPRHVALPDIESVAV